MLKEVSSSKDAKISPVAQTATVSDQNKKYFRFFLFIMWLMYRFDEKFPALILSFQIIFYVIFFLKGKLFYTEKTIFFVR